MRHFFIMKDMRRIIRSDRRKESKLEALVISTNDRFSFYNEMPCICYPKTVITILCRTVFAVSYMNLIKGYSGEFSKRNLFFFYLFNWYIKTIISTITHWTTTIDCAFLVLEKREKTSHQLDDKLTLANTLYSTHLKQASRQAVCLRNIADGFVSDSEQEFSRHSLFILFSPCISTCVILFVQF